MPERQPLPADEHLEAAEVAGLVYLTDDAPGWSRRKSGKGFTFLDENGKRLTEPKKIDRARKLGIPPAWQFVWISPRANSHLQATGRDARGRKQYIYHARWREVRDETKFGRLMEFAQGLPALRKKVKAHMALPNLSRERVLATITHLLETTLIRVGNEDYARDNKSYGLTTLRNRHVDVDGHELFFDFKGKSGKHWKLRVKDRRIAHTVRLLQELPGQNLFQYVDDDGAVQQVDSSDINAYLKEVSGQDITAKDFRTWAGTVLAALALQECEKVDSQISSATAAKRQVREAIERVAGSLGNTVTICRKCYVHPELIDLFMEGILQDELKRAARRKLRDDLEGLKPEEAMVLTLLERRLGKTA